MYVAGWVGSVRMLSASSTDLGSAAARPTRGLASERLVEQEVVLKAPRKDEGLLAV
jgi:hypothetical protein